MVELYYMLTHTRQEIEDFREMTLVTWLHEKKEEKNRAALGKK